MGTFNIAVDNGGTFTDCVVHDGERERIVAIVITRKEGRPRVGDGPDAEQSERRRQALRAERLEQASPVSGFVERFGLEGALGGAGA